MRACMAEQSADVIGAMLQPVESEQLLTETLQSVRRWPKSRRYLMVTTHRINLLYEAAVQKATCVAMLMMPFNCSCRNKI